jgi:PTH1 family peptidyl-tRNA hydrolase
MGAPFRANKSGRAVVVEGRLAAPGAPAPRIVLARPRSYMNEVGGPVKALATFYKVLPDRVVAIHDELDIAFGTLRVKFGGGDNGHNGLRSMRSSLGTGDFYRVRAGIGRPPGRQDPADFVLSRYSSVERKELPFQVDRAADAVECLVEKGLEATQQRFNS